MQVSEYSALDATGLAELIRRGDVSQGEVLDAAREASSLVNDQVNAVIEVYDDVEDLVARPDRTERFFGVPSLRKDIHSEAGRLSEFGTRLGLGHVAVSSSQCVDMLAESGLRFIGRSTTSELALYGTTETAVAGDTRNPYDLSRSAGGSSGGAGAAVASGIVPMADASDAGGSIRIPASCNGLVGLKTSAELPRTASTLSDANANCDLVLARSVRDVVGVFAICHPGVVSAPGLASPSRPRVAVSTEAWAPRTSVDPEIVSAVEDVARRLEDLGGLMHSDRPRFDVEAYWHSLHVRVAREAALECEALARIMSRRLAEEYFEPVTWLYVTDGQRVRAADIARSLEERNSVVAGVCSFFERYDVLVTPTLQVLVPPLGTAGSRSSVGSSYEHIVMAEEVSPNLAVFNMSGHPAISIPSAVSESGLPIGVQLVGRVGSDAMLLQLARALEEQYQWQSRRPAVHASDAAGVTLGAERTSANSPGDVREFVTPRRLQ